MTYIESLIYPFMGIYLIMKYGENMIVSKYDICGKDYDQERKDVYDYYVMLHVILGMFLCLVRIVTLCDRIEDDYSYTNSDDSDEEDYEDYEDYKCKEEDDYKDDDTGDTPKDSSNSEFVDDGSGVGVLEEDIDPKLLKLRKLQNIVVNEEQYNLYSKLMESLMEYRKNDNDHVKED